MSSKPEITGSSVRDALHIVILEEGLLPQLENLEHGRVAEEQQPSSRRHIEHPPLHEQFGQRQPPADPLLGGLLAVAREHGYEAKGLAPFE